MPILSWFWLGTPRWWS